MSMPSWDDQPANKLYKKALAELGMKVPHWWPHQMYVDVVGGDLPTGSVIYHLPIAGDPYVARLPRVGPPPGNTQMTMDDLMRQRKQYEWDDGEWKWVIFSRYDLTDEDLHQIKDSMR